jgi:Flp pilus assembly secretin CpaC
MKIFTIVLIYLFIFTGAVSVQSQSRGGVFAAAAAPGQVPAPTAVTPQPVAPQPPGVARPTTPTQQTQQQQEQLRIVADPATNSLIIYGTAQEFQNIKNILKDLDAIPRQVLLDVMIMEVTMDDSEQFGIDYEINRGTNLIFDRQFGSQGAVLGRVFSQLGITNAAGTSFFPAGISGVIGSSQTVRALINALMTDSRIRILSSPSVLASDNRPARIQVGSEEPQATGTLTAATGAVTPSSSTTIQYRNTGRIVTIIPQVNSQGLVNLQILAEVSQRGAPVTVGQDSYPSFDIRQAETTAVVQDGDTLAIGGIIAENRDRNRRGIPYLMDIPVVGRFFGTTQESVRRTELIMLITPNVIRNRSEGTTVTEEFKAKLSDARNELDRIARDQAKSKPKPRPQELAPMPEPHVPQEVPQPNPSSVPGRGAEAQPAQPISSRIADFSDQGPAGITYGATQAAIEPRTAAPVESRTNTDPGNFQIPKRSGDVAAPKPQGFALSIAPARLEPPPVAARKPEVVQTSVQARRVWAVQVAASADLKDAEALAERLRHYGHEAYVMIARVEEKVWHRVRIGKFVTQYEAQELRKALTNGKEFRQAYVALN